jgi:hypothetical protein
MNPNYDFSTIDLDALKRLPVYKLPASYHLQEEPGNGCFGEAPGHPSYFTRSVYTKNGNSPRNAPQFVITFEGVHYAVACTQFVKLYKPLPIEHPRVQAWIASKMTHLAGCYADDRSEIKPLRYGKPDFFVFPILGYALRVFRDDARFSNEWRMKERTAIAQQNAELQEKAAKLATVDNHLGVRSIRKVYPDFWKDATEQSQRTWERSGDWWEREAVRPSVESCKPPAWLTRGGNKPHEVGGYCQHCGRELPAPRALQAVK